MSDEKKPDLMDLTALVTSDYPDLADESEDKPENDMLAQMDHDAIRQFLKRQGYAVHKHRSAKAAIAQANDVAGKKRLTAYVPTGLRQDLQYAIAATGKSLSTIVAESLEDWMNKQGYRRPGT